MFEPTLTGVLMYLGHVGAFYYNIAIADAGTGACMGTRTVDFVSPLELPARLPYSGYNNSSGIHQQHSWLRRRAPIPWVSWKLV